MRRSSAFAVLAACVALVAITVLATGSLIAANAWTPLGERPTPTPRPSQPGPQQPPGDGSYGAFLDEVRAGNVLYVDHQGSELFVNTDSFGYRVEVPDDIDDVHADILAAAAAGGVDPPRYARDGLEEPSGERTYEQMLAEISEGLVFQVTQEGDELNYDTERGRYAVVGFEPDRDVVADIRAAAADGGVPAPSYTWYEPQ